MIRIDPSSASRSSRLRIAHAVVLAMAAGSLVAGPTVFVDAGPGPEGQDRGSSTIKSGVSLVSVDFLALGRDGRPVPDLKPDEVTLRIGGRPRPVDSLNMIEVAPGGGRTPVSPLPAPFGSNIPAQDSRAFVLVVDDDSFRVGTERALREAADTFLDNLAPTDHVALVTMPYGGTRVDLTTEQEKVRASLAQVIGQGSPNESADDMPAARGGPWIRWPA